MAIFGQTSGLSPNELKKLERLSQRRLDREEVLSWPVWLELRQLSKDLNRQLGLVVDRKGKIETLCLGDAHRMELPDLERRMFQGRLGGFRLIKTHLGAEGFTVDDDTEVLVRRLDMVLSLDVQAPPDQARIFLGHLRLDEKGRQSVKVHRYESFSLLPNSFLDWISDIEAKLEQALRSRRHVDTENRTVLCHLRGISPAASLDEELLETRELAENAGLSIVGEFDQQRRHPHPKHYFGEGKVKDLALFATKLDADLLLFHNNLSPNQARWLTQFTNMKVLDRTQLILDIFAQRAKSHEGKLQVELAQLKYTIPRLREKSQQMSRLVGGIGGRGPGETKLEIHRRRADERVRKLTGMLAKEKKRRKLRRQQRNRRSLPIVAIVGYTNAGKSTLLNQLTQADAYVENLPFATLDPFSKRLRFPKDQEVILTDTVGFIRDLPKDLFEAFGATLEEIGDADLILHVVDVSHPNHLEHIQTVNNLLSKLAFDDIPKFYVFNKIDAVSPGQVEDSMVLHKGFAVSALDRKTCAPLLEALESALSKDSQDSAETLLSPESL